jgi:SAM-dependent methyltransferase
MRLHRSNEISQSATTQQSGLTIIYALTVFLGAFLLFQVQPLIGKYILPWFGGSPEVWTTCMLFFQVLLLAGYAYAHLLVSRLGLRLQAVVHVILIAAALVVLPITPHTSWKPASLYNPILQILLVIAVCIGPPYFVLSATGPLIQRWFSRTSPGLSPYRLYALSNAGSLIALVSYPFVVEPVLSRRIQSQVWSLGFVGFGLLCACCAMWQYKHGESERRHTGNTNTEQLDGIDPTFSTRLLWLALPAAASVELLAVTNKICQDVAAIPFLWVLPLSVYLVSFVICFQSEKWYVRPVFVGGFILAIVGAALAWVYEGKLSARQQIWIYSALLFACCMVCHGELFRLRPRTRHLTHYYLMIAAGGAIGGVFVAVVAPLIFETYRELHVGILACCLFVLLADRSSAVRLGRRRFVWVGIILVAGAAAIFVPTRREDTYETAVLNSRNFFGVLTIWEEDWDKPARHRYILQHGTTFHGLQFVAPPMRLRPTAYYGRTSGVGLAIECFHRREKRRIGAVGLGVGTLAAYGREGDYIRFYEINPEVRRFAETRFSYLSNCPAEVDVVMGDARLSMEAEPSQAFDLLVLDAFTSGTVPAHLLTKEAFQIYLRHLKPDGVIAVHVSSAHLKLESVVLKLADHLKLKSVWIEDPEDQAKGTLASDWILLTNNEQFLEQRPIRDATSRPGSDVGHIRLWTDEYINLLQILR